MNRRGFLAGVIGLCAGLPLVGRFVPKPHVVGSYLMLSVEEVGKEWYSVYTTTQRLSDGSNRLVENWRIQIKRNTSAVLMMSAVDDPTDWEYSPMMIYKTVSTSTGGFAGR